MHRQVVPALAVKSCSLLPLAPREWLADNCQVYLLLHLVEELGFSETLISAQGNDPGGGDGVWSDPLMT